MFKFGTYNGMDPAIPPPNTGLKDIAQARVDNTVSRYVERHKNAMSVDGIPVKFFGRHFNRGATCTCCRTGGTDDKKYAEIVNPGQATTSDRPKIINLRNPYPPADDPTNSDALQDFSLARVDNEDDVDDEESDIDAILKNMEEGIFGGEKASCPICFGTGNVENYLFVNGKRFILDASEAYPYEFDKADIDQTTSPFTFKLNETAGANITWQVDLPAFADDFTDAIVFNRKEVAKKAIVEFYFAGNWHPLDREHLLEYNGEDKLATPIRVIGQSVKFTHVEWLQLPAKPIVLQTSHPSFASNNEAFDPFITLQFEASGDLPYFNRDSYFVDSKLGYVWRIIDFTPHATAQGQVFGYEINARIVQRRESASFFSIYEANLYMSRMRAQRGLETVQNGSYDTNLKQHNKTTDFSFSLPKSDND